MRGRGSAVAGMIASAALGISGAIFGATWHFQHYTMIRECSNTFVYATMPGVCNAVQLHSELSGGTSVALIILGMIGCGVSWCAWEDN